MRARKSFALQQIILKKNLDALEMDFQYTEQEESESFLDSSDESATVNSKLFNVVRQQKQSSESVLLVPEKKARRSNGNSESLSQNELSLSDGSSIKVKSSAAGKQFETSTKKSRKSKFFEKNDETHLHGDDSMMKTLVYDLNASQPNLSQEAGNSKDLTGSK